MRNKPQFHNNAVIPNLSQQLFLAWTALARRSAQGSMRLGRPEKQKQNYFPTFSPKLIVLCVLYTYIYYRAVLWVLYTYIYYKPVFIIMPTVSLRY